MEAASRFLSALLRTMLRLALLVLGALLVMGALVAALMLASGAVLWALVRGRRPAVRAAFGTHFDQARRQAQRVPAGEVIDIEVREVREVPGPR